MPRDMWRTFSRAHQRPWSFNVSWKKAMMMCLTWSSTSCAWSQMFAGKTRTPPSGSFSLHTSSRALVCFICLCIQAALRPCKCMALLSQTQCIRSFMSLLGSFGLVLCFDLSVIRWEALPGFQFFLSRFGWACRAQNLGGRWEVGEGGTNVGVCSYIGRCSTRFYQVIKSQYGS